MNVVSRDSVPLSDHEICLVKGLIKHRKQLGINQQRLIAYFSFPQRTVHHNVISAIAREEVCASVADYPPSDLPNCRFFLDAWTGDWQEHNRAAEVAGAPNSSLDEFEFGYRFHPVGQGLFCSGHFNRAGQDPFRWVYDCGTEAGSRRSTRARHVRAEMRALQNDQATSHLDLVTLSHFDEDHLSGMLDLLKKFSVGTLLLPYLTPWERLIVAISEQTAVESDLFTFLTAPTEFLLARADMRIERILLVPPSAGREAAAPPISPDEPTRETEPEALPKLLIKDHKPEGENDIDGLGADDGLADPRVRFLHPGGYILVSQAWEFVPYNDCRLEALATNSFKNKARPLAHKLTHAENEEHRQTALKKLTKLYDATFKSRTAKNITPRRRNEISLFLYAGPIGRVELVNVKVTIPRHEMVSHIGQVPDGWLGTDRFGQILTGDGFLHTKKKVADFMVFYSVGDRISRGAIFQVMHHGSDANWRDDIASLFKPVASLYCSDPLGKWGHPGAKVRNDFADYHPVQVDGVHGWQVNGTCRFL
ncbi:hypothetical protein EDD52_101293 [Primorskyibacter sedentarius]|uniref:Metallo-beta-lactamase domain-containing protein n=1 Tax=Primorskyibacter sedentarius TaxID=745311 RepID=A0A4R3JLG2_9RHOB|nr:hypothetical protein [Primorskyibacter sedentarius]TCS67198.1 hypothetical protein EDD52_101293 [Primorskyibacter sedentarius]